jgi:hypothetical protein
MMTPERVEDLKTAILDKVNRDKYTIARQLVDALREMGRVDWNDNKIADDLERHLDAPPEPRFPDNLNHLIGMKQIIHSHCVWPRLREGERMTAREFFRGSEFPVIRWTAEGMTRGSEFQVDSPENGLCVDDTFANMVWAVVGDVRFGRFLRSTDDLEIPRFDARGRLVFLFEIQDSRESFNKTIQKKSRPAT